MSCVGIVEFETLIFSARELAGQKFSITISAILKSDITKTYTSRPYYR